MIERTGFESDARGNECRLDRAKLFDAAEEMYRSSEQQRRVTPMLRAEGGGLVGDPELRHDWSFEVPQGTKLKTFKFVFADEHADTGGADPDENVTERSFDVQ